MDYHWYDIVGNIGVITILCCYLLLQTEKMQSHDLQFSLLNGLGAFLILVSLVYEFNMSAFLVEFFWLVISIIGSVKALRKKSTPNPV